MFSFIERHLEESIAGICVLVMTVLVFLQVVLRYVFNAPTSWSDEIAVYAMVWSVYLSCSWAVRERAHIRVMNFINLWPRPMALMLTVLSDAIWFLFRFFLPIRACYSKSRSGITLTNRLLSVSTKSGRIYV